MSDYVEGIVAKITEKPTSNGGTMYNICMEIEGSDDEWFGHGFDEPSFGEGAEIGFDISYNGKYANVDTDSVDIISEGEPKPKPSRRPSKPSRGSGGGRSSGGSRQSKPAQSRGSSRSKPETKAPYKGKSSSTSDTMSKEEWACKDKIIRRQACMNTAINLIGTAVKCELVALPTKKADKLDAFIALCDEEAIRLYDQYEEQVYGGGKPKRGSRSTPEEDEYDDDIPE